MTLRLLLLPGFLLLLALGSGCRRKAEAGGGGGMGGPQGPLEVSLLTLAAAPVTLSQELPGRVSAFRVAEVRARVNGIVLRRLFEEGSTVQEGQVLYQIDPAPYEAALRSAEGQLRRAEASLETARIKEQRYGKLLQTKAISPQDYDDVAVNQKTFEADVLSGRAAVETARINFGYTRVVAPVTGRIGVSQVTEGAYVQEGAATLLATVQELDKVYVDVTQASSEVLRLRQDLASGRLKSSGENQAVVKLLFEDNTPYAEEGTLQVADVTVNPSTNSVLLRAIFPNPRNELLPGLFVRGVLEEGTKPEAILVPQSAVTHNAKGEPTAMVAGAEEKAEVRVLETARAVGNQWLVTKGLKAGERVILDNLQRVRPGAQVKAAAPASPGAAPKP